MPHPADMSLLEAADALNRRALSAVELVSALLERIEETDSLICAYIEVNREEALQEAQRSDDLRAKGDARPLLGVPIAVKDILNVKGWPCTCASRILQGYRAPYDATAIARLREAGAIFVGRTNMDEFAMGSTTENSCYQVTRNPWDPNRVPGGSSGGSAAAVAAREAIAALGTDTGGSIRQPAAFCGCVGLKPTYGRVSRYGLVAYASSLDQIGPITRTVEDAAFLLGIISGHDPKDSTSLNAPVPDFRQALKDDLRGIRIGWPKEYITAGIDPEIEGAIRHALVRCKELGAEIREISLPHTKYAVACYYLIATAEASTNLARYDGVRYGRRVTGDDPIEMYGRTRAAGFGLEVKRRIILGTYALSRGYYDAYYLRAQKVRTLIRSDFEKAFQECDVIVAPVAPTPAYLIGEKISDPLQMYLGDIFTVPANLAGICGISVPCGFTEAGLPIGLQILGPALREDLILRSAYAYEQATDWHLRKPPILRENGCRT